jgi:spermidine synthase
MIPWTHLDTASIPNNGGQLKLTRRGDEFSIHMVGVRGELMNSRAHFSEEALATLGCAHLKSTENARVLVGGMGMGFTLAAALKSVSSSSQVIVAELIPAIIQWNQGPLGDCAGHPLSDPRTSIHLGDVADRIKSQRAAFDAILLDVDNGPEGFTHSDNNHLYSLDGLKSIRQSLRPGGVLAVWSAWNDSGFSTQLKKAQFKAETKSVRARAGKGSRHTIYLART